MPAEKPTPTMDKLQHAASHQGRFAPQRSSILPHNPVKLAASKATLELTDEKEDSCWPVAGPPFFLAGRPRAPSFKPLQKQQGTPVHSLPACLSAPFTPSTPDPPPYPPKQR